MPGEHRDIDWDEDWGQVDQDNYFDLTQKERDVLAKTKAVKKRTPRKTIETALTLKNRYYVAADRVTKSGDRWAKPTLEEAIEHAREMLEKDSTRNEVYIVQIIRRVRRESVPTVVDLVR